MELKGNTILITGGSAGIGLALAKKFAELGNDVIVTGRKAAKLEEAKASSPNISTIQSDAGNSADIRALAAQVREQHPELNVLINNAGVMFHRNLTVPATDLESLTAEIDINVSGPIRLVSAFIDQIKQTTTMSSSATCTASLIRICRRRSECFANRRSTNGTKIS